MIGSLSLKYKYFPNGYSYTGSKIPDIPIVKISLLRKDKKMRATGTAIIDTGFDGGIYPNIKLLNFFEGLKPFRIEKIGSPLGEIVNCEVYKIDGALISEDVTTKIDLGEVNVYIPINPEYINDEVLVGREILNKLKIILDGTYTKLNL